MNIINGVSTSAVRAYETKMPSMAANVAANRPARRSRNSDPATTPTNPIRTTPKTADASRQPRPRSPKISIAGTSTSFPIGG